MNTQEKMNSTTNNQVGKNNMTVRINEISPRKAALVAGIGMLIISVLSPFGYAYAIMNQIVPGDAVATVSKIIASEGLFRAGICCLLINAVLDIVVAWALYILLKPVNKSISLLSAWFRLAYSAILVVALSNLFSALQLINSADYLAAFTPNQLHAQVMHVIDSFFNVWDFGLVIFGLHLLLLGYLVYKSAHFPKFLGILLQIAGIGYLHDPIGKILFANYGITISQYLFIGEFLLIFWVLHRGFKGFNQKGGKQR